MSPSTEPRYRARGYVAHFYWALNDVRRTHRAPAIKQFQSNAVLMKMLKAVSIKSKWKHRICQSLDFIYFQGFFG
ncbi:hypothetical protein M5K25_005666 [Dendrobium thyrsiflorum]|uniref:Uncharacterized protein n=1 Tax=Dendrobium thyrsiflorum TaxID=117978 RepID=A0ABD0VQZ0_DENTH